MKGIITLFVTLVVIISFSCKKDNDTTDASTLPIYGKWTVDDDKYATTYGKHMIVENGGRYHRLRERAFGFRTIQSYSDCVISETTIIHNTFGILYYTIDNNELFLSPPYSNDEIIFFRDDNVMNAGEWVKKVTPTQTMESPIEVTADLAYKDQYIWFSSNGNYKSQLFKIDINTLTAEPAIILNYGTKSIEWADGNLWVTGTTQKMYRIDINTGAIVEEGADLHRDITGLGYDGENFWCTSPSNVTGAVIVFNIASNAITHLYETSYCNTSGVTCSDEFIYILSHGVINKCTKSPFQVVDAYTLEDWHYVLIGGITMVGDELWISSFYQSNSPRYRIEKIDL